MKYEPKDVKESENCKNDHKCQFIEADKAGHLWQYCTDCDRKLLVR